MTTPSKEPRSKPHTSGQGEGEGQSEYSYYSSYVLEEEGESDQNDDELPMQVAQLSPVTEEGLTKPKTSHKPEANTEQI